jgi:sugar/nucleoside kinase (ribokinase family)
LHRFFYGVFLTLALVVERIVRPGETISSKAHESQVGGKGANQAVAIARAGGIAYFYGTVGRDGIWVTDKMKHYGIDVGGIIVSDVRNPSPAESGSNSMFVT